MDYSKKKPLFEILNIDPDAIPKTEINYLHLSVRAENILLCRGIYYIDEVLKKSPEDLGKFKGWGSTADKHLIQKLKDYFAQVNYEKELVARYKCPICNATVIEGDQIRGVFSIICPECKTKLNVTAGQEVILEVMAK